MHFPSYNHKMRKGYSFEHTSYVDAKRFSYGIANVAMRFFFYVNTLCKEFPILVVWIHRNNVVPLILDRGCQCGGDI